MSELSPKTRALLDAARSAGGSTPGDRARVFASIAAKAGLAVTAGTAASAPSSASAASAPIVFAGSKVALVVVIASSIAVASAGATVFWLRSHRTQVGTSRATAPVGQRGTRTLAIPPPVHEPPPPMVTAPLETAHVAGTASMAIEHEVSMMPAPARATPVPAHARSNPRSLPTHVIANADRAATAESATTSTDDASALGEELALLRGARAALRSHDEATAVGLLEQHARRFPNGMLREERGATLVLALCGLGRRDAAAHAAHEFFETFPHSPYADRVRASCAGETP